MFLNQKRVPKPNPCERGGHFPLSLEGVDDQQSTRLSCCLHTNRCACFLKPGKCSKSVSGVKLLKRFVQLRTYSQGSSRSEQESTANTAMEDVDANHSTKAHSRNLHGQCFSQRFCQKCLQFRRMVCYGHIRKFIPRAELSLANIEGLSKRPLPAL